MVFNPESQKRVSELMYIDQRCALYGRCAEACPTRSIELVKDSSGLRHSVDRKKCSACVECVKVCPSDAPRLAGREACHDQVFSIILQDYLLYLNSDDAAAPASGEPTMQPEFALALLRKCEQDSLYAAIQTCGFTE